MPAVAPYPRSPWSMAQTIFVALPDFNSALLILKLKLFTLVYDLLLPNVKNEKYWASFQ